MYVQAKMVKTQSRETSFQKQPPTCIVRDLGHD